MSALRFGVLGAAKIAGPALVDPASRRDDVAVVAVASRDRKRAEAFAKQHGIEFVVESYAELVAHPEIDCVYNALPPSGHAPWSIRALEAGKHVLCEKPFCLNVAEAEAMVAAAGANDRVLCEGFHDRYHPLFDRVIEVVRSGEIGALRHVDGRFTVPIPDESDIRHQLHLGGGATMDLGCYPVHHALTLAGPECEVLHAEAREGKPGIDVEMHVDLRFASGVTAHVHTGMAEGIEVELSLRALGTNGELFVRNPIHPSHGHEFVWTSNGHETREQIEGDATFVHQLGAFVDAVRNGTPLPTGGDDAIATMRVLESIYQKAGLPPRGPASA